MWQPLPRSKERLFCDVPEVTVDKGREGIIAAAPADRRAVRCKPGTAGSGWRRDAFDFALAAPGGHDGSAW